MKKLLLAALLAVPAFAWAGDNYVRAEGVYYSYDSSPNDKYGLNLQVGHQFTPGLALDIKQEFRNEENTQKISNRLEVGATLEEKLYFFTVGVRGAVGEKFTDGDNFEYWLAEPFAKVALTDQWSVKGSWRYRNAFDSEKHDQTNTYKATVAYKYTDNTSFDASLAKTVGNSEYTAVQAGITYKF